MINTDKKEHPILFSTGMVKAILEGRKTMTRRVIKNAVYMFKDGKDITPKDLDVSGWVKLCPYGQVGDRLWVRETWAETYNHTSDPDGEYPIYKADGELNDLKGKPIKWKPSIFMHKAVSRITLEITNIRVERLQDIAACDCLKEGLQTTFKEHDAKIDLRHQFQVLWDSINAKRGYSWESNPWVWVIEFKWVGK